MSTVKTPSSTHCPHNHGVEADPRESVVVTTSTGELLSKLLLSKLEVCHLLGDISPKTVDYLHRMRKLRGVLVGKSLRWKPETVRQYVEGLKDD